MYNTGTSVLSMMMMVMIFDDAEGGAVKD